MLLLQPPTTKHHPTPKHNLTNANIKLRKKTKKLAKIKQKIPKKPQTFQNNKKINKTKKLS